jgi:hypothetical protein
MLSPIVNCRIFTNGLESFIHCVIRKVLEICIYNTLAMRQL